MLDKNVEITVDENLKRSKALEEAGLLDNVTGKLSKNRRKKIDELYLSVAVAALANDMDLETPMLHLIIAGLYTMRTFDPYTWSQLEAEVKQHQNEVTDDSLSIAILAYGLKRLPHGEFPLCLEITLEESYLKQRPNWRKFMAEAISATAKYVTPAPDAPADIIMPALKHMNDHSPELFIIPAAEA